MKNMDWRKIVLYAITSILGALLFFTWQKEHQSIDVQKTDQIVNQQDQETQAISTNYNTQTFLPKTEPAALKNFSNQATSVISQTSAISKKEAGRVHVTTDVLDVTISLQNGDIVETKLIKYPLSINDPKTPIQLLSTQPQQLYIAQNGLWDQQTNAPLMVTYQSSQPSYRLLPGDSTLQVELTGKTPSGLIVKKTYSFTRGQYVVDVNYSINNTSNSDWKGSFYQQITRGGFLLKTSMHSRSYTGVSLSSDKVPYDKIPFKQLIKADINQQIKGGWLAMQQQYFLSAWIPPKDQLNHFFSHVVIPSGNTDLQNNIYTAGYFSPLIDLGAGQQDTYKTQFYSGPELSDHLKSLAPNLDRTIDYGWLWFISQFIFIIMQKIHQVIGNWGWSIVMITLLVRCALYWFSARSYRSMAKMRDAQPKIQALKDRLGDDRQALTKATMEFYRKEKINPMGGCLPMIVQIPVFFALYYVLVESVQLRQAPFILWIKDLSVHDPYYVLPVLMGLSMLLQQKLSPPPPDPTQAKMMMLLPLVFTVFFLSFPAGLVLYWLTNNCATVAQQWYVMRNYDPKTEQKSARQKKKTKNNPHKLRKL